MPEERQLRNKTAFVEHLLLPWQAGRQKNLLLAKYRPGRWMIWKKRPKKQDRWSCIMVLPKSLETSVITIQPVKPDLAIQKPFSESTSKIIDDEIIGLLAQAYQNAKGILAKKKPLLDQLATLLLTKEEIDKGDLEKILGTRSDFFFHLPIL
ncbi:hypothetical protein [Mucilaginibacter sp. 3215]|uniref:hypothetical protein n=1 Tax=Mucilaginibacter sp. 3215 TaxID=3373912 RepID=UPI003D1B61E3